MNEDEEFYAWLDGELDAGRAAQVEARVAASPELTARAADHLRLTANLKSAFAPVLEAGASPPKFGSADMIDFGARAAGRAARRPLFGISQWAAMAATLALGVLVGNLASRGAYSPVAVDDHRLVAAASLDQALDTQLASAPPASGARIGLTFRDARGHVCRSFQDSAASGLACRDSGKWRIQGLFPSAEGQVSDYRMAAGQDPRLAALLDQTLVGEPFDAAQERAAREQSWR
jgi:hypothetical protein